MNKFPTLNGLRVIYDIVAGLIVLAGIYGGIDVANSTGKMNYTTNVVEPNIGNGLAVIVVAVLVGSMFTLIAEMISLGLRIENHLDQIRSGFAPLPSDLPYASPVLQYERPETTSPVAASKQPESVPVATTVAPVQTPRPGQFKVRAYQLGIFEAPTAKNKPKDVITGANKIQGYRRDLTGDWVYAMVDNDGEYVEGWVQSSSLDIHPADVFGLPVE